MRQIYVMRARVKIGPFSDAQARELLAAGELTNDLLAWREGEPDTVPLMKLLPGSSANDFGSSAAGSAAPASEASSGTAAPNTGVSYSVMDVRGRGIPRWVVIMVSVAVAVALGKLLGHVVGG
jgi:hypothetical protein